MNSLDTSDLVELLHLLRTHRSFSIELTIHQLRRSLPTMTRKSIGSLLARFGQVETQECVSAVCDIRLSYTAIRPIGYRTN
ncbi:mediator of rna polymerase ii transcription subunit 7 [Gossypium arboreum]|uniref:Mediator of rna polymerase ii transcription subunit 7 n=1 Tax=Gossypium arboreum TaxID=29729 RepID=A0A0B0PSK3_GOSAR|nr:mediator of rna polymerase ii transcription subunit 7 [Gossypium arboreum]